MSFWEYVVTRHQQLLTDAYQHASVVFQCMIMATLPGKYEAPEIHSKTLDKWPVIAELSSPLSARLTGELPARVPKNPLQRKLCNITFASCSSRMTPSTAAWTRVRCAASPIPCAYVC